MARINIVTDNEGIIAVKLTDSNETMAQILARIRTINANGHHVYFDMSAIPVTNPLYLCTIYMDYGESTDPTIIRLTDQVTGKMYIGSYLASETIAQVLAKAVDAYVGITVTARTNDGVTVTGQTVSLYEGSSASGILRETKAYEGNPITFMVAKGFQYFIQITDTLAQHFSPNTATGTANANTNVTITYQDVSSITSFTGLQAALATFSDVTTAKNGLVGKVMDDIWIDNDTTGGGDAKTRSDAGETEYTTYPSNTDANNHPIWYDPLVITDVKAVEDADGASHSIAAVLIRKYCSRYDIVFDAANTEEATEATAVAGVYYYGLETGQTSPTAANLTILSLNEGDAIPYSDYAKVYKNAYRDTSKNMIQFGHNRYETSAIRQYLNTNGAKNTWWVQKHVGQVKPSSATNYSGYMLGCSSELLAAIKDVKHTVMTNTVSDGGADYQIHDKFFLPSVIEMFGTENANEGSHQYEYWRGLLNDPTALPNNNNAAINAVRKLFRVNGKSSASHVWLRSAIRGNSYNPWYVTSGGILNYIIGYYGALAGYAAVPACVIY